jgi:hypothetical protein
VKQSSRGQQDPAAWGLGPADILQIRERGGDVSTVLRQLALLSGLPPITKLVRPCTVGDGIETIPEQRREELVNLAEEAAAGGRFTKFVPASGAATRMFRTHLEFLHRGAPTVTRGSELDRFVLNLKAAPFFRGLREVVASSGGDLDSWIQQRRYREILECLLGEKGLGYATLPKALLPFHTYPGGARTALEEHFVDAAGYVRDGRGLCRLHVTGSPHHLQRLRAAAEAAASTYAQRYGVSYDAGVSAQSRATETPALDGDGRPFRLGDGHLLFRAAGHGALLENLDQLHGDIVFITNVDNVVPDWLKPERVQWKQVLAGYLVELQTAVFDCLRHLENRAGSGATLTRAALFAERDLGVKLPSWWSAAGDSRKSDFLLGVLNRPVRVCGMVRNQGEPGGGPFWVENDGRMSRQIVESAQVDADSDSQHRILDSATHFNPVDIVCGVRDRHGARFDLGAFVDHGACFVSTKSHMGRPLRALELPGLWNGGMAHWLTVFVEVPASTFTPVKTVMDLLRREHQPPTGS